MHGFIITIGNLHLVNDFYNLNKNTRSIEVDDSHILWGSNGKFPKDEVLINNDYILLGLSGIIVNKKILVDKYGAKDWQDCVEHLCHAKGNAFYNEMRGSFNGFVYKKSEKKWIFFTDHIGDKQILYYHSEKGFAVATEVDYLANVLKQNGVRLTLDKDAAYMALTLGYVIEDKTLFSEIHKLPAGHYLEFDNTNLREIQYHRFSNKPVSMSVEEAVEGIDKLFREAVRLDFEKDLEYGYKHMATLSGGLDSRMTVWVAHELGYQKQLNLTFCQSNYLDFTIAQSIATDLGHDFIFKALDNGNCIYDIDNVTKLTGGSACFFGVSHTKSLFDVINYDPYGLVHTGEVGDVIVGSFLKKTMEYGLKPSIKDAAYSVELIDRLKNYKFKYDYEDAEMYMLYNRGFGFVGQGLLGYDHEKTETLSPFCNVDFMEFCFSIPLILRYRHKIYFDWVIRKYPQAAEYVYEALGGKIKPKDNVNVGKTKYMTVFGMKVPHYSDPSFGKYFKGFILRRLGLRKKTTNTSSNHTVKLATKNEMNPVDYWYNNNAALKSFMDGYWMENKDRVKDKQLLEDMRFLYEDCEAAYDKLQTLSLLSAIKMYL